MKKTKQKRKQPWWVWVLGGVLLIGGCNAILGDPAAEPDQTAASQPVQQPQEPQAEAVSFTDTADTYFADAITGEISEDNGSGKITFVENADYFETGDKINKVMAIESARLFREVPGLKQLQLSIPASNGTHELDITREQLEGFYGGPMSRFSDLEEWRSQFLPQYDTEGSRAAFAQKFVQVQ